MPWGRSRDGMNQSWSSSSSISWKQRSRNSCSCSSSSTCPKRPVSHRYKQRVLVFSIHCPHLVKESATCLPHLGVCPCLRDIPGQPELYFKPGRTQLCRLACSQPQEVQEHKTRHLCSSAKPCSGIASRPPQTAGAGRCSLQVHGTRRIQKGTE